MDGQVEFAKTLTGERLRYSKFLYQTNKGFAFVDSGRYFVFRIEEFKQGVLLYDTKRALEGDVTPVATIQVDSGGMPGWVSLWI